jgi:hypothetical protein
MLPPYEIKWDMTTSEAKRFDFSNNRIKLFDGKSGKTYMLIGSVPLSKRPLTLKITAKKYGDKYGAIAFGMLK